MEYSVRFTSADLLYNFFFFEGGGGREYKFSGVS